jgi:four helix bundle protein
MVVRKYQDLITWQLTEGLRREVFRIIRASHDGWRDLKFRGQIVGAGRGPSKHVVEGFLRKNPGEFARFLAYALSSIGETEGHIRDGIELGYFPEADCLEALRFATRSSVAATRLMLTQKARAAEEHRLRRRRKPTSQPGSQ